LHAKFKHGFIKGKSTNTAMGENE